MQAAQLSGIADASTQKALEKASTVPMLKSAHVLTSDRLLSAKLAFPICGDRKSNFEVQNLEFRYSEIIVDYTRYYPEGFR